MTNVMVKTSSKNANMSMSKLLNNTAGNTTKSNINRLHKAVARAKNRTAGRSFRSVETSVLGRDHEWDLGIYSLGEFLAEDVYDENQEAVPLFICVKSEGIRRADCYDVMYPLALLGVIPRNSEDIAVIQCAENEVSDIDEAIRPVIESGDFCLVWDQSGVLQDLAFVRTDMFRKGEQSGYGYEFLEGFDFTAVSDEDARYVSEIAICNAERNYAQAIGILGGAGSGQSEYIYAKQAIEAFGNGYVDFMLSEEDFDEIVHDQFWRHDDEIYAAGIVRRAPDGIFDKETFDTWEKARQEVLDMMRIWQAAIELANLPVNVVGYRYNEEEVYNREFDVEMTRKLGDIIGAHPMLDNYFVHGVPIEDILA